MKYGQISWESSFVNHNGVLQELSPKICMRWSEGGYQLQMIYGGIARI
jgi:hypothetical protein